MKNFISSSINQFAFLYKKNANTATTKQTFKSIKQILSNIFVGVGVVDGLPDQYQSIYVNKIILLTIFFIFNLFL